MMKFLRKNQKKILAVFTVGLMIAFVADTGINRYYNQLQTEAEVMGTAGDVNISSGDVRIAEAELRLLLNNALVETGSRNPDEQFITVLAAIPTGGLPGQVIQQWLDKPVTFALLKEEARRMPVFLDPRDLNLSDLRVRLDDGRTLPFDQAPPEAANNVRYALADYLRVLAAFQRASDAIKTSQPLATLSAVQTQQDITVDYVEISAESYLEKSPEPSPDQLQQQFEKYANVSAPAVPTDPNPLALGYRYPPRVKLQYLALPREQLKQTILRKGPPGSGGANLDPEELEYRWTVAANKYYLDHQSEFPTTAPAATQPATQPTTRPFAEVREQVIDRMITPQINTLAEQIRANIESTLRADYDAWAKAQGPAPATGPAAPATQPLASSLGVPYDSYAYLQKLAARVQQQYGVLPTVASIGELQSEEQVSALEGIGPIAREAFAVAAPFATATTDQMRVLQLYQPSRPRATAGGDTYLYRVTAAEPSRAPASLDEVREQVVADVKKQWAWEQARAEAQKLLDEARASSLTEASDERPVQTAGPLSKFRFAVIPGIELQDLSSRARFIDQAYKLLAQAASGATTQPAGTDAGAATQPASLADARPMRLIELPGAMKILVAQLASVDTRLDLADLDGERLRHAMALRQDWQNRMLVQWLSYEGVSSRLGFVDRNAPQQRQQEQRTAAVTP